MHTCITVACNWQIASCQQAPHRTIPAPAQPSPLHPPPPFLTITAGPACHIDHKTLASDVTNLLGPLQCSPPNRGTHFACPARDCDFPMTSRGWRRHRLGTRTSQDGGLSNQVQQYLMYSFSIHVDAQTLWKGYLFITFSNRTMQVLTFQRVFTNSLL